MNYFKKPVALLVLFCLLLIVSPVFSQDTSQDKEIDDKVRKFLDSSRYRWRDMNVPETDGRILYDLIIKNGYKKALEVGTSTGHSAIWIAWALSKTRGKLITIEIDKRRYEEAKENFEEAGLSRFIDARLADAHELVPELEGPFDFVFIDADKDWYTNYAKAIVPNLEPGGCMTAHNISTRRYSRNSYSTRYLRYLEGLPYMETTVDPSSRNGLAVSYRKKE